MRAIRTGRPEGGSRGESFGGERITTSKGVVNEHLLEGVLDG